MIRNGELVIHIGPPKTATTSLQFFLQGLDIENFVYGGVIQPRGKDSYSICSLVYKDIKSGEYTNKNFVIETISKNLKDGKTVFLSEECFLVESRELSWKKIINRLADYFYGFNPSVIVTVREPKKSIISYYHEIYASLSVAYQNDFKKFLESNYCEIYNYRMLHDFLEEKFDSVVLLDFTKLVKGKYLANDLLLKKKNIKNLNIFLKKENASSKKDGQYYTKPRSIRNKFTWIFKLIAKFTLLNRFKGKGYGAKFLNILPDIQAGSKKLDINFDDFDYSEFISEYDNIQQDLQEGVRPKPNPL